MTYPPTIKQNIDLNEIVAFRIINPLAGWNYFFLRGQYFLYPGLFLELIKKDKKALRITLTGFSVRSVNEIIEQLKKEGVAQKEEKNLHNPHQNLFYQEKAQHDSHRD